MKSICLIIPNLITTKVGGAELQIHLLAEELIKRGWKVEMLSSQPPSSSNFYPQYYNKNITYHYYKRLKNFPFLEFFTVLFALLKTNSTHYYQRTDYVLTASTAFFCKIKNKKMIYALADDDCAKSDRFIQTYKMHHHVKSVSYFIKLIQFKLLDWAVVKAKKFSHFVIAQTSIQKKLLYTNLNIESTLIRNSYVFKNNFNLVEKENIIIWVGNLRKDKNPETFVKLASEVKLNDWKFVVIGSNKNYYREIEDVKMDNFQYLGALSLEETEKWFMKAKIIVHTGEMEGFPNTFIQAWVFKVYLLSLHFNPDNLIYKYNLGSYVEGDYNALKEKLIKICTSYYIHSSYLDNAQQFAFTEFNISKNIDKLENILLAPQYYSQPESYNIILSNG